MKVIQPVSSEHYSTDEPLKKLHSEGSPVRRGRAHYIPSIPVEDEEDISEKPQTDRYSSNRKF